jgi:RimJ/RimL family protein N-acetyltransferase
MSRFKAYYNKFLGVNKNEISKYMIVESDYRDMPLNKKYFYPIIISKFEGNMICSSSNQYINMCRSKFDGTLESITSILEAMNKKDDHYRIRKMRRYSIEDSSEIYGTKAEVLTEDMIRNVNFKEIEDKEKYIRGKQDILQAKRQFVVLKDNNIASTAFISEIYSTGCNIVVYTSTDYRHEGHGKEVVKACINWCQQNNLVPIYLVEEDNQNSIKLAESLALELKSHEWIISK